MTNTITINDKQVSVEDLTEDQKKFLNEAMAVQKIVQDDEYKLAVLKARYEALVQALDDSIVVTKEDGAAE